MKKRLLILGERIADKLSGRRTRAAIVRFQRRVGLTQNGFMGLALAFVLWGFGRVIAGKVLYLFAYGALLLIIGTWATAKRKLPLEGSRSDTRARAQVGEVLGVEIGLTAKRALSTIVLEEELPERLGQPVTVPIPHLASGQEIHHSYRLHCRRRGSYQVGPLVVRWGDPIGLTQREQVLAPAFELLVHPQIEPASDRPLTRAFDDPPIRPPVSKPWPSGMEFYGMREYAPGDDLRRVVWKAFARTGKLLIRESEQGVTDQITIIVDTDPHNHSRGTPSESFETAVKAAASLAVQHLRDGYTMTVMTNDGPMVKGMRTASQQIPMLDAFARLDFGKKTLGNAFLQMIADPRRDAHNILITPRLTASTATQLRMLLNKGASVLVVALVWDEESTETLNTAAALGCQVVEVRPGQSIQSALALMVGAGRR